MLGKTAVNKTFYNQICVERVVNGEKVYTPIAGLYANVPEGTKIPSNINVNVMDQALYNANADMVAEDYKAFQAEIEATINQ